MELNIRQKNGCPVTPTTICSLLVEKTKATPAKPSGVRTLAPKNVQPGTVAAGISLSIGPKKNYQRQIRESVTFCDKATRSSKNLLESAHFL